MKLSILNEGNYTTYIVRIERIIDDKITGTIRYEFYKDYPTEIKKDAKDPKGLALRNARHRASKSLGISFDDVKRNYRATIISPKPRQHKPRQHKPRIEKRNILCRACGQLKEPSQLGDICIHCYKDT